MVRIKVTSDVEEVFEATSDAMTPTLAKGAMKAATFAGGAIAEVLGAGDLARSFLPARFVKIGRKVGAGAFSDLPYAQIQDQGGTIRSKKGASGALAIPLKSSSAAKNQWPREWPADTLFVYRDKKKNQAFLAEARGKRLKLHYILVKSVDIEPKDYINEALDNSRETILEIMDEAAQEAIDKGEAK